MGTDGATRSCGYIPHLSGTGRGKGKEGEVMCEKGRRERERKREKGGVNESMSAKKGGREEGRMVEDERGKGEGGRWAKESRKE